MFRTKHQAWSRVRSIYDAPEYLIPKAYLDMIMFG
jgi:hypothetical protein